RGAGRDDAAGAARQPAARLSPGRHMSKRYGRVLAALVAALTAPQRPWRRADTRLRVANSLIPTHEVATRHGNLAFVTTHPEALQYPRELTAREPETIEWIDAFAVPCRFWDIGANVGTY